MNERAKVQLTDIVVAAIVTIAAAALGPVYYDMISVITADADPLSELMLQLVVPFLFLGIIISMGVSARRSD